MPESRTPPRYPQIQKRIASLAVKSGGFPALARKLGMKNTERARTWLYGRSSPTPEERAILAILEADDNPDKSAESYLIEWHEAAAATSIAVRRGRLGPTFSDEELLRNARSRLAPRTSQAVPEKSSWNELEETFNRYGEKKPALAFEAVSNLASRFAEIERLGRHLREQKFAWRFAYIGRVEKLEVLNKFDSLETLYKDIGDLVPNSDGNHGTFTLTLFLFGEKYPALQAEVIEVAKKAPGFIKVYFADSKEAFVWPGDGIWVYCEQGSAEYLYASRIHESAAIGKFDEDKDRYHASRLRPTEIEPVLAAAKIKKEGVEHFEPEPESIWKSIDE